MAEEERRRVVHEHVVTGNAEQALERLARVSEKVRDIGREAIRGFAALGGLAGAFEIGSTIREVGELYGAVGRVKSVTGETAENSYAILQTFEKFGISVDQGERALTRMTIRGEKLEEQMSAVLGHSTAMTSTFKRLGIDLSRGPIDALEKMAAAAQKGKLSAEDIVQTFHVPIQQAGQLLGMLKKGPEAIKAAIEEAAKSGAVIDQKALDAFQKMKDAKIAFANAWEDLVGVFVKRIIPILTPIIENMTHNIDKWAPLAQTFADILGTGLSIAVNHLRLITALMILNKGLAIATGEGISGHMKNLGGSVGKGFLDHILKRGGASAGAMIGGSAYAIPAAGHVAEGFGGVGGAAGGGAALAPIAIIAAIVAAVVALWAAAAYSIKLAWQKHIGDIVVEIKMLWDNVVARFEVIGNILSEIGLGGGRILAWAKDLFTLFGESVLTQLRDVLDGLKSILEGIVTLVVFFKTIFEDPQVWLRDITGAWAYAQKEGAALIQQQEIKRYKDQHTIPGDRASTIQNFFNPVFHIDQKFAEGYDPDRIALAFQNDMAALGERQRQSGLAQLYGPR